MKLGTGILIAIEGIDGSGKTTLGMRLAKELVISGYEVVLTREPTDGPHGRRIRASAITGRLSPEEELEEFVADRAEHVELQIKPAIKKGFVVIVDRYYFSSMAYQGARGLDPREIQRRNEAIAPRPDLLVILEIDPRIAVERAGARGATDLFEREEDLRRAAKIYSEITEPAPLRIDATKTSTEIVSTIMKTLESILPE